MREILFRGKSLDNGEWIEGYYCPKPYTNFPCKPSIFPIATINKAWFGVRVIPETVGQFTGLTDKNGNKIFEGDIIQSTETKETAIVQWFSEHSAFMVWCKSSNEVGFLYDCEKSIIDVIGNIHDNPELLKGETPSEEYKDFYEKKKIITERLRKDNENFH